MTGADSAGGSAQAAIPCGDVPALMVAATGDPRTIYENVPPCGAG